MNRYIPGIPPVPPLTVRPVITEPCPYCDGSGYRGQHGYEWRCTFCAGKGLIWVEQEPNHA